jgi:hypothetical protein
MISLESLTFVMAGPVPAIHVLHDAKRTWMPGTRPGMTSFAERDFN